MIEHLRRLAVKDKRERLHILMDILRECGLDYNHYHRFYDGEPTDNIVISFGKEGKIFTMGAHYDNVPGSCGANDDMSGVCILIDLARRMKEAGETRRIDICFFDWEEKRARGSKLYLEMTGAENIAAMANLDICGYGERVVVHHKGYIGNEAFLGILDPALLERRNISMPGYCGPGDDLTFAAAGIPNCTMAVVPESDCAMFSEAKRLLDENPVDIRQKIMEIMRTLSVGATMHNGCLDSPDIVTEEGMAVLRDYLAEGLGI